MDVLENNDEYLNLFGSRKRKKAAAAAEAAMKQLVEAKAAADVENAKIALTVTAPVAAVVPVQAPAVVTPAAPAVVSKTDEIKKMLKNKYVQYAGIGLGVIILISLLVPKRA